jgi:hypothetical protein
MSILPNTLKRKLLEEQPHPEKWSRELEVLLDPKIEARPLSLPGIGQIKPKTSEYVFYWVRRKRGNSPDTTRYMQMRAAGYTNATLDDVDPQVSAVTTSEDGTEITCGVDLVLMKAKPEIHYGAMKLHWQKAIDMTNPRGRSQEDALMRSQALNDNDRVALNGTRSNMPSESEQDTLMARANEDNSVRRGTPKWDKIAKDAKK